MSGHRHRPLPAARPVTQGLIEAKAARLASTDALLSVIEQGPAVRELVDKVHEHGRRNHFGELLEDAMRRRRP